MRRLLTPLGKAAGLCAIGALVWTFAHIVRWAGL